MSARARGKIGVIVAAHGELGGGGQNGALREHVARLVAALPAVHVGYGLIKGEPSLEQALADAQAAGVGHLLVYPFLMSDGYFTSKILPEQIGARVWPFEITLLPPLGLDRGLAGIVTALAIEAARERGLVPLSCHLALIGHGSKLGPASANAARGLASQVEATGVFRSVTTAFLEEAPLLEDHLRAAASPLIVAGLFTGEGVHGWRDVPDAMARLVPSAIYTGPVGVRREITQLIVAAVRSRL